MEVDGGQWRAVEGGEGPWRWRNVAESDGWRWSLVVGDGQKGQPLILTYHRHMYGLGEHYNSVIKM